MSITLHLIDDNWEMQIRIMRFIYVPCPHAAEVLADVFEDRDEVIKAMRDMMLVKFDKYWSLCLVCFKIMKLVVMKVHGIGMLIQDATLVTWRWRGVFNDYFTFIEEDNHTGITSELDHYLQEKVKTQNSELDILSWWKTNGFKYPTLQKIARDILAIPISTVASESAFSTSGRLVSPHRSRLHPKDVGSANVCPKLVNKRNKSGTAVKKRVEDVMPIATGHEREELEAIQGKKILEDVNNPVGPFGTKESPAVVKSYYDKRIVGCPGGEGEDEHDVVWFWLEKGKPHECPVCSQYFVLEVVGPGGPPDGHGDDDHHH
ncbi:Cytochrome c oxidase subunit 5b-1 [Hibiscus syriacus]|uniref:Cytochrome c oxidase subunit 5b-1 n=1 Tax=Hibiscus syriacus TaxID=106335 RepID=A0A6A2YN96_HIBSY|nr:Cytochrome c oxidase subunit 5b-1 [Hibiscus syriacus]